MKLKPVDIAGNRYARLTVLRLSDKRISGKSCWECVCDCGNLVTVIGQDLKRGATKSCGCYNLERLRERGTLNGMHRAPEYLSWCDMKRRCYNRTRPEYKHYGGRGIAVCDRWRDSFANFLQDMGYRPDAGYSVDRIDNDGHYCPENCRWATRKEQSANRRTCRVIEYRGELNHMKGWANALGFSPSLFMYWSRKGLTDTEVLDTIVARVRARHAA